MKVLVTSASRHGGTTGIATRLASGLRARHVDVDVRPVADVADVDGYDAVVLGSAVYMGRWLPEALRMLGRCGPGLQQRPVWLFSSGPVGTSGPDSVAGLGADLLERTGALEHRVFGGRLDRSTLGHRERAVVRLMSVHDGDDRDPDAIDRWAAALADALAVLPDRLPAEELW